MPSAARLAFRELGLSIGLRCLEPVAAAIRRHRERFVPNGGTPPAMSVFERIDSMARVTPLAERIEGFWLAADAQNSAAWAEHLDINSVMLATSLVPGAFILTDDPGQTSRDGRPRAAAHR